jgi:hypothetical protein
MKKKPIKKRLQKRLQKQRRQFIMYTNQHKVILKDFYKTNTVDN